MTITLTHQIRYAVMIDEAMDKFPVKTLGDFEAITTCLNSILDPKGEYVTRKDLAERKKCIADFLNTPSLYVQYTTDYDEYQALIRARITAKINELGQLTEAQKQACIDEQEQRRISAEQNQMIRAEHSPPQPGEERYIPQLTEEEQLQELQEQFQVGFPPFSPQVQQQDSPQLILPALHGAISTEQYEHLLNGSDIARTVDNADNIRLLIQEAGVTFTELVGIQDSGVLHALIDRAPNVFRLIHTMGVPLGQLVNLPEGPLHVVLSSPESESTREFLDLPEAIGMLPITSISDIENLTGQYVVIATDRAEYLPTSDFRGLVGRFLGTNMFYAKVNGVVTHPTGCFFRSTRVGNLTNLSFLQQTFDFDLNGSVSIRPANEDELDEMGFFIELVGARFGTEVETQAQLYEIAMQRQELAGQQQEVALAAGQ